MTPNCPLPILADALRLLWTESPVRAVDKRRKQVLAAEGLSGADSGDCLDLALALASVGRLQGKRASERVATSNTVEHGSSPLGLVVPSEAAPDQTVKIHTLPVQAPACQQCHVLSEVALQTHGGVPKVGSMAEEKCGSLYVACLLEYMQMSSEPFLLISVSTIGCSSSGCIGLPDFSVRDAAAADASDRSATSSCCWLIRIKDSTFFPAPSSGAGGAATAGPPTERV
eukprot:CAMPEP_0194754596 /NCGR_PEP_ID=MMETSP0323_2-20130528/8545_1 /TAXON_ID=2866 ORGANISM="Crypthecodinium cohnii, Strain Seligo" /NCGR_SAMPLE_ID=MMETSP0323_2 /ASSEMBLY_ACC=CAM_ASM_000346 /LENGTH=227 /DNA_ID=CAMNT_0039673211 /DNA_START=134 /DNA_END=819 /DNA_ORIENTATION=-